MLPIKRILWPTDFSEASCEALKAANELALHFSAELILVHVVPPLHIMPTAEAPEHFHTSSYPLEMEASARDALRQVVEKNVSKEIKTNAMVIHGNLGNVADEIVNVADHEKTDIIIIATHGQTGWRRFMFGSVAEKVIRMAPCPVLSIQFPPEEGEE